MIQHRPAPLRVLSEPFHAPPARYSLRTTPTKGVSAPKRPPQRKG